MENKIISGFSRLGRSEKLDHLLSLFLDKDIARAEIESYRHPDPEVQRIYDEISENAITNFCLPFSIAPNFLINGKLYILPLVTEESSVVAAIAKSAKFWSSRGGFRTEVSSLVKNGQVHFFWDGDHNKLMSAFPVLKEKLMQGTKSITSGMAKRGGGIKKLELIDRREEISGYYQLNADFDTRDSMGANFINSCLEEFAIILRDFMHQDMRFENNEREVDIIMSILSNYTPDCLVTSVISCSHGELGEYVDGMSARDFARKFHLAVSMARVDVKRAVTHNKGIFNGIDAIVIATGNDFRAVEAAGHAWAARDGIYRGLSVPDFEDDRFSLSLTLPVSIGTVGGLTGLHPLARRSLEMLGDPGPAELMGIIASAGLASNFAAIRSLIAGGIQSGHMRMHLSNILSRFEATEKERVAAEEYFRKEKVGYAAVEGFLADLRGNKSS
jgi:hydroxymethylglutaryl-CoA reductase